MGIQKNCYFIRRLDTTQWALLLGVFGWQSGSGASETLTKFFLRLLQKQDVIRIQLDKVNSAKKKVILTKFVDLDNPFFGKQPWKLVTCGWLNNIPFATNKTGSVP